MEHVTRWFNEYKMKTNYTGPIRVFVATDEIKVLDEIRSR